MISRRGRKSKIFLSVVIPVVKAAFVPFSATGEKPLLPVLQGFAAFRLALFRIPPRHTQTTRATNCANPGFLVIQFCSRCGQTCGQAVFLTISVCGGSACIAGVSRDCGHGIFRLEGGATCSQTRRDTNFAIPGYSISAMMPKCFALWHHPPLFPVARLRRARKTVV